MITLIRMFKACDKTIMFRDCLMRFFFNIYLRRKEILLIFFCHFEIERDFKERQLCMGDWAEFCKSARSVRSIYAKLKLTNTDLSLYALNYFWLN